MSRRNAWAEWDREGRDRMADRAQARAEQLLAEHQVTPLAQDVEQELDEIMREAKSVLLPG